MASGGWAGSTRREQLGAEWRARRAATYRIHGRICYICKGPGADAVDHVIPGNDHSQENLRPIHQDVPPYCHRSKTAGEGASASAVQRRRIVAARKRPKERHPGEVD